MSFATYFIGTLSTIEGEYEYYYFKDANFVEINYYLSLIDWNTVIFGSCDIIKVIKEFYNALHCVIDLYVPKRKYRKPKFPKWFNNKMKELVINKKLAHKKYKDSGLFRDYEIFSDLRAQCRIYSETSHREYIHDLERNIRGKREFWKHVNAKRANCDIPKCMNFEDKCSDVAEDVVQFFAENFASVYVKPVNKHCDDLDINYSRLVSFKTDDINVMDVFEGISNLKDDLGCGPDGIPVEFWKGTKFLLSDILTRIFNRSLNEGIFPDYWKTSYVTPIFKSGDRTNVKNYRAITKICVISKIFESIMAKVITPYFKNIVPEQHGFVKYKSTVSNLLEYQSSLLAAFKDYYQVDVIFTDMEKAFDTVDIALLINKLYAYGITGTLLDWLRSYLTGRKQSVKIKNVISEEFEVPSGVPQGGHLSPLLFNAFVNDLIDSMVYSEALLYADDLKFFRVIKEPGDCDKLQSDLNKMVLWCKNNHLKLNISKCKVMSFYRIKSHVNNNYHINNINLERTDSCKDLGVIFDRELSFIDHVQYVSNKAMKLLGFMLRSLSEFNNVFALKNIYCAIVRSVLEYAAQVWSPYYRVHVDIIEKVQKKFLRFIAFKVGINKENIDYKEIMSLMRMPTLESRREFLDLCTLYKILNGQIDSSKLLGQICLHGPCRRTRQNNLFHIEYHRTNYTYDCPISRFCRKANNLPENVDFFNMSFIQFKNIVNGYVCNT